MTNAIPTRLNPFPLRLRLVWNETLVMDAQCSVAVAYDVARAHIADNFAGLDHAAFVGRHLSGAALDRLIATQRLDVEYRDASGYARVVIEPAP